MRHTERLLFYEDKKIQSYQVSYDTEQMEKFLTNSIRKYEVRKEFDFSDPTNPIKDFTGADERTIHGLVLDDTGYHINAGILHFYPEMIKILIKKQTGKFGGYDFQLYPFSILLQKMDQYMYQEQTDAIEENDKKRFFNQFLSIYTIEPLASPAVIFSKGQEEKAKRNTKYRNQLEKKKIKIQEKRK